jgi:carbon starvation protein CstA
VEGEERCLPACTRRRSDGVLRLVRRASSERSVLIDVFGGSVRGIAGVLLVCILMRCAHMQLDAEYVLLVPETFLMKICMVSSFSEPDELMLEMLDERRMVEIEMRFSECTDTDSRGWSG